MMALSKRVQMLRRHDPAPAHGWPLAAALGAVVVAVAWGAPDAPGWLMTHGWPVAQVLFGIALGCLAPGAALVRWLWPGLRASAVEHLALAAGAGVALAPLVTGIASLGGLGLARPAWWILGAASVAWLAWGWWHAPRRRPALPDITAAALLAVLLLVLFARLFAVRDQFVATYDGYHHTMIAQLLVDHGGLFQDWAPYAPLSTFTYHFGFHALVAATHWLGGAPVTLATLYVGQLMLFGTTLAAAALAGRLTGVPGAALWAAILVGLVNLQPAYYAFWGRYTYPAGQIALVACLLVWLAALEAPATPWRLLLLGGVVAAGMALTHYQVAIIAGFFVTALLLQRLGVAARRTLIRPWLTRAAAMGGIALLLVLPWAIVSLQGALLGHSLYNAAGGERAVRADPGDISAQVIVATLPAIVPFSLKAPLLALALLGALLARWRGDRGALTLALWSPALVLTAAPHLVGLPGVGVIPPIVAFIGLYLVAGPLGGYVLALAQAALLPYVPAAARLGLAALVAVIGAWSLGWQRDVVPPYARMVTPADMAAYAWIRSHTPADALFLVNGSPIHEWSMIAGIDGGFWIPLLAGRPTTVPPMTYGNERCRIAGCDRELATLYETLRNARLRDTRPSKSDLTRPAALAALRERGVAYVYFGALPLNGPGIFNPPDLFERDGVRGHPAYRQVYAAGGVEIYEVVR
ncbi:MAG: hypothetical protein KGS47_02805 [Chloroflexi bacterium]|nr:hypothetical protein [Chloroflexota bacterium]